MKNHPKRPTSNDDDLLVLGIQDLWVGAILLGSPPASPFVADVAAIQQRLPCSAMISQDVPGLFGHVACTSVTVSNISLIHLGTRSTGADPRLGVEGQVVHGKVDPIQVAARDLGHGHDLGGFHRVLFDEGMLLVMFGVMLGNAQNGLSNRLPMVAPKCLKLCLGRSEDGSTGICGHQKSKSC